MLPTPYRKQSSHLTKIQLLQIFKNLPPYPVEQVSNRIVRQGFALWSWNFKCPARLNPAVTRKLMGHFSHHGQHTPIPSCASCSFKAELYACDELPVCEVGRLLLAITVDIVVSSPCKKVPRKYRDKWKAQRENEAGPDLPPICVPI